MGNQRVYDESVEKTVQRIAIMHCCPDKFLGYSNSNAQLRIIFKKFGGFATVYFKILSLIEFVQFCYFTIGILASVFLSQSVSFSCICCAFKGLVLLKSLVSDSSSLRLKR